MIKGIISSSITACSERDNLVLNNGVMCYADFCQNSLTICFSFRLLDKKNLPAPKMLKCLVDIIF